MNAPRGITRLLAVAFAASATLWAMTGVAQTTYRWIDKNGQTIYSDQPPPAGARQVVRSGAPERDDEAALPYATRRAVEKFPVTLYTAANCVEPCERARALLNGRGVPFTEKLLKSEDELAELARELGGEANVPTLYVGRQHVVGFEGVAWNNLLDLAAYPKTAPYGAKPSGAFAP